MRDRASGRAAIESVVRLARVQEGVIARWQAIGLGMTGTAIRHRLASGRWRTIFSGGRRPAVYATFTGPLGDGAQLWAAVLVCGSGAVLSHESAAWRHGLRDELSRPIHVTIPSGRHISPPSPIRIHYSSRLAIARHPVKTPPCTRVEETVVDLTQTAASVDHASGVIAEAVRRGLTAHERIIRALRSRRKLAWRRELMEACGDVSQGQHTLLEIRYVRRVERPHGLPAARRQARYKPDGRCLIVDCAWPAHRTRLELDGQRGHTGDGVFRDVWRDNQAAIHDDMPLRLGWGDVNQRHCLSAAVVAKVLLNRGWDGWIRACGPQCNAEVSLKRILTEDAA